MTRARALIGAAALALAVVATACSSDAKSSGTDAPESTTTTLPGDEPVFAQPGPYAVGYTTLQMPDRAVDVWYPVDPASVTTKKKATYDQTTPLPENLKGLVPPKYNTVVTMNAYKDVPASDDGPFPVLLFSHGFGGYRMANSALTAGVASWGYVVVSVDYEERGIQTQITGGAKPDAARDQKLMLDGLELVQGEGGIDDSVLGGAVDVTRVAVAGHSAGGSTAFNALHDRRVKTAIGWAPVGPSKAPADKPTMIIGAALDSGITPVDLKKLYASFPEPKRRIEIGNAGHNTFTDVCVVIRGGGGLIEFARDNNLVAPGLLELAYNGCEKDDLAPEDFWPVVQHFTVAQMRDVFGPDPSPAGLDDAIADAWDPVDVTYEHQP